MLDVLDREVVEIVSLSVVEDGVLSVKRVHLRGWSLVWSSDFSVHPCVMVDNHRWLSATMIELRAITTVRAGSM